MNFFKSHGLYEGIILEIRLGAAKNKSIRCNYLDDDMEDIFLQQLNPYKGITLKKLSPIKPINIY